MTRFAAVLLVALCSTAASAAEPAWQQTDNPDGTVRFACGQDCADTALICVRFSQPGDKALRVEDMVDEVAVAWGQIDFSTVSSAVADRELGAEADVTGGERSCGPEVLTFGGADWVGAGYDFAAGDQAMAVKLLLWPKKSELLGLRCSYRANGDVTTMVEDLAVSLRS